MDGEDRLDDPLATDFVALAIGHAVPSTVVGITLSAGVRSRNFLVTVGADGTVPWVTRRIDDAVLAAAIRRFQLLSLVVGSGNTVVSSGGLTITFTVP